MFRRIALFLCFFCFCLHLFDVRDIYSRSQTTNQVFFQCANEPGQRLVDSNGGPSASDHSDFPNRVQFAKGFVKLLGYPIDFSGDYVYDSTGCVAKDRRTGYSSSNWYFEDRNSTPVCLFVYDGHVFGFCRNNACQEQRLIEPRNESYDSHRIALFDFGKFSQLNAWQVYDLYSQNGDIMDLRGRGNWNRWPSEMQPRTIWDSNLYFLRGFSVAGFFSRDDMIGCSDQTILRDNETGSVKFSVYNNLHYGPIIFGENVF